MFGKKYLRSPDLVFGDRRGRPWGEGSVDVLCAASRYKFFGLNASQEAVIRNRYGDLVRESTGPAPDRSIEVLGTESNTFFPMPSLDEEFSLDFDHDRRTVRFVGHGIAGQFDREHGSIARLWSPVDDGDRFRLVFENCLRVVAAYRLLAEGGVLVHSSCVVDQREARVFFGKSGAGKSTIARISLDTGKHVLSDDMNALRPGATGFEAWPIPFAGDYRSRQRNHVGIPLCGLYRIEKATENVCRPLQSAIAVASLMVCSPFANRDPHCQGQLMTNLAALIRATPCSVLSFLPNERFWRTVVGGDRGTRS
jgi:hypothetical protein